MFKPFLKRVTSLLRSSRAPGSCRRRRPVWVNKKERGEKIIHIFFYIPSSAWQLSSRCTNNIQSSQMSVLGRSMFVWAVSRGSGHLSPACAQRTAAETRSAGVKEPERSGQTVREPKLPLRLFHISGGGAPPATLTPGGTARWRKRVRQGRPISGQQHGISPPGVFCYR